jgi:RNA-directed DNA polymerase
MQKGKCVWCGLHFRSDDLLEVDHVVAKSQGGKDEYGNHQLLHGHCHDSKSYGDGSRKKAKHPPDEKEGSLETPLLN